MHSQTAKTKIDKGSLSTGEHGAKPRPIKNRRQEIAAKAAEFFAEFGFDASTRDFAKYLGTTQPFPVLVAKDKMIMNAIDIFLDGYDAMLKRRMRKE